MAARSREGWPRESPGRVILTDRRTTPPRHTRLQFPTQTPTTLRSDTSRHRLADACPGRRRTSTCRPDLGTQDGARLHALQGRLGPPTLPPCLHSQPRAGQTPATSHASSLACSSPPVCLVEMTGTASVGGSATAIAATGESLCSWPDTGAAHLPHPLSCTLEGSHPARTRSLATLRMSSRHRTCRPLQNAAGRGLAAPLSSGVCGRRREVPLQEVPCPADA